MTKTTNSLSRLLVPALVFALCGFPELVHSQAQQQTQAQPATPAQDQQQTPSAQPASPAQDQQSETQQPQSQPQQGTTYNPSSPPLAPVPSNEEPSGQPSAAPEQPNAPTPQANAPEQQKPQQPLGAAAAENVPTAGGAASRPAGNAIAPAKQRQTRSLLIKLGAIAAAGIAIGTVVALSKGSGSKPPGAP
jgi:cytoskeletal protein RodZ